MTVSHSRTRVQVQRTRHLLICIILIPADVVHNVLLEMCTVLHPSCGYIVHAGLIPRPPPQLL